MAVPADPVPVITMAAIVGWMGINNFVLPGAPMGRAAFFTALTQCKAIGQWRGILRQKLGYNAAQAAAVADRPACINLLMAACPFQ